MGKSYSTSVIETNDNRAEVAEGGTYIGKGANVNIENTQNLSTNFDENVSGAFQALLGTMSGMVDSLRPAPAVDQAGGGSGFIPQNVLYGSGESADTQKAGVSLITIGIGVVALIGLFLAKSHGR